MIPRSILAKKAFSPVNNNAYRSFHFNQLKLESKSLSIYLSEITKTKPLSSKEEAALTIRIRNGDKEALHKLIKANLRFVVSVAKTYQNQGLPLIDLINEGNFGLIEAAHKFDEDKNFRFISYAVWWVRHAILNALAENSRIVRFPRNRIAEIFKIGIAQCRLEQQFKRSPSTEEIAHELQIRDSDVQEMVRIGSRPASLDAHADEDSEFHWYNAIPMESDENEDDRLHEHSLKKAVAKMIDSLDSREREIICLYYGIGKGSENTLKEISEKYGLTLERIRQIIEKTLSKLKRYSRNNGMQAFLIQ